MFTGLGALAYHNERLLLLGGEWIDQEGTADVEEYDIERGTWSMWQLQNTSQVV